MMSVRHAQQPPGENRAPENGSKGSKDEVNSDSGQGVSAESTRSRPPVVRSRKPTAREISPRVQPLHPTTTEPMSVAV